MTSRRRRAVAVCVVAPLSALGLSTAVEWAIEHDPTSADTVRPADTGKGAADPHVTELRTHLQRARATYIADRHRLLTLQHQIERRGRQVAAQRAANAARIATAQVAIPSWSSGSSSTGGSTSVPASPAGSGSGSSGSSAPAPPPPPPPPPPPTQSTTGASG